MKKKNWWKALNIIIPENKNDKGDIITHTTL